MQTLVLAAGPTNLLYKINDFGLQKVQRGSTSTQIYLLGEVGRGLGWDRIALHQLGSAKLFGLGHKLAYSSSGTSSIVIFI